MLSLQVVFTILSAVCIAILIPVGVFLGWVWAGICAISAFPFFMLMLLCKQSRERNAPPADETENSVEEPTNE